MNAASDVGLMGVWTIRAYDRQGRLKAEIVEAANMIVNTGLVYLAGALSGAVAAPSNMKYLALGIGTTAVAEADVALESEVETRVAGAQSLTSKTYTAWANGVAKVIGDKVEPTVPNGYYYVAQNAGTTNSVEPSWDTTPGGTTADNDIIWTTHVKCANDTYQAVGTFTFAADQAVTEYGLLDQASGGVLLSRIVKPVVNMEAGEQMTVTYQVTMQRP